ncbi:MAG: AAA family ATPase [Verrucomicrobiota bacterium]
MLRNTDIPAGQVCLADHGGKIMDRDEAILQARAQGLDLVCFDAQASPPQCKFDQPPPAVPLPLDISEAPTPLALAMREFEKETQPFRKVHRLIDAIEVFTKLHTVVVVSDLFSVQHLDEKARGMLAVGLKQPSLGVWWMFARDFVQVFNEVAGEHRPLVPRLHESLSRNDRGSLRDAMDGEDNLIAFRNGYAHGATPADEKCLEDIAAYEPRFRRLLASATHLREALWVRVDAAGHCHNASGVLPVPIDPPCACLLPGRTYAVREGRAVSLHPLLVYLPEPGGFFFYNDLRKSAANFLNYELAEHRQDGPLGAELLDRYPIYEWAKAAPIEFAQRVEELTETFKGRQAELKRMAEFTESQSHGFLMVWGGPGIGKSALLARFFQVLKWPAELRATEHLESRRPAGSRTHTLEYFIRRATNRTDTADFFLENLNQRLDRLFPTGLPSGNTTAERQRSLDERLAAISHQLAEHDRLVILIDGLDEAADSPGFLDCLPKSVPERVLIIYSSRPHPRVRDRAYRALDREHCQEFSLGGLGAGEARAILSGHVSKYKIERGYLEEVARRSQGNPLYLNLLAQCLGRGDFALNNIAILPEGMVGIYQRTLERVGKTPFAVELLQLLTVARDFVTAAMANHILGLSGDTAGTQLFPACMEFLEENRLTEHLDDYQLFHESLRDYLRIRYRGACRQLSRRLYNWCLDWPQLRDESKRYALRHLAAHARDLLDDGGLQPHEIQTELDRLHELATSKIYQQASFEELGSATAYQAHCRLLLERLADMDADRRAQCGARALWHFHVQPERRRQAILAQIDAGADDLRRLEQFAAMGRTPRDCALLALRGLSARPGLRVPPGLQKRLGEWCEQTASKALADLCRPFLTNSDLKL